MADGTPLSNTHTTPSKPNSNTDWFIFSMSVGAILGVCTPLILYPEAGKEALDTGFNFVTQRIGIAYVLAAAGSVILLAVLAFGRHGSVVLGPPDSKPSFSTFSWCAMLFCGGIGSSVVYWGTIEWAFYFQSPPMGVEPLSDQALLWATAYPLFHWGITGWSLYCLPAVAIAYAYHVGNSNSLRLSSACRAALGSATDGPVGRLIDLMFMVGLLGATSTGLGLAVPLISAVVNRLVGTEEEFALSLAIIALITALFAISVYVGLDRGIKRLSNLNVGFGFLLLIFVLLAGPTVFIIETSVEAFGQMVQNFVTMSTYADAQNKTDFVGAWTVFYWAWWLALGPFMGIFITKISRGRTIKELILCSLGYGSLGCMAFFMILGNYALFLEQTGAVAVLEIVNSPKGAPHAIAAVLAELPGGSIALVLFGLLCLIFAATSYDSASYTLASAATKDLPTDAHPPGWHRMFWAFFLGILPITLIYLGGLRSLQSAMVIVSVPLLIVLVILTVALFRNLRLTEARTKP